MEFMTPLQMIFQLNMVTWSCTLPASFKLQPVSLPQASWMIQIRPQIPSHEDLKEAQLIVAFGKAGDKLNLKIQCRHPTLVSGYPAVECWGYWWKRRERERIKLWYPWDLVFENLSWVCFVQKRRGMKGFLLVKPLVTSRPLNRKQRLVNHISNAQGWPDQVYIDRYLDVHTHICAHTMHICMCFEKSPKWCSSLWSWPLPIAFLLRWGLSRQGLCWLFCKSADHGHIWPWFCQGMHTSITKPMYVRESLKIPKIRCSCDLGGVSEAWDLKDCEIILTCCLLKLDSCSMLWKMIHHSEFFLESTTTSLQFDDC